MVILDGRPRATLPTAGEQQWWAAGGCCDRRRATVPAATARLARRATLRWHAATRPPHHLGGMADQAAPARYLPSADLLLRRLPQYDGLMLLSVYIHYHTAVYYLLTLLNDVRPARLPST